MKGKIILVLILVIMLVSISSCCFTSKMEIGGQVYDTYGLINKDENRDPSVEYELSWGNIVLGAVFCETVIAPIWFFGFDLWEPVGLVFLVEY